MTNPARRAIEILEGALLQCAQLSTVEREQIHRRIEQLQRREKDPRIFIAFIGEKKAGKTALVRALTGVPLPVAVRECTAAVCEIQIGLDWHHQASYQDGRTETYEAIDNSEQEKAYNNAKMANKEAAENAINTMNQSEADILDIQEKVIKAEANVVLAKNHLDDAINHRKAINGAFPWIWRFIGWLSILSSAIRKRLDAISKAEEDELTADGNLLDAQDLLNQHREAERKAKMRLPEIWDEAKATAAKSQESMDDAQHALHEINVQNEEKFADELSKMIDVALQPAERVTIYTPNQHIPHNIVLLDTPGFNTELQSHRRRAWEAIEEMADICILVSDLRQPMPDTALNLLERLEPYCPILHVALTKTDLAYAEAEEIGDDPLEEIAEAENVARSRIKRRWEGDMHIWTVASIRESDQVQTRNLFKTFWRDIPKDCRESKSSLLGAQAIKELLEMITVHLQRLQDNLEKFDDIASDLTLSIATQMDDKKDEIQQKSKELIQNIQKHSQERLTLLHENWTTDLQKSKTKHDLTETWEELQTLMQSEFQRCAQEATYELELGIESMAKWLCRDDQSFAIDEMPIDSDQEDEEETSSGGMWLWTAAGASAGAAFGFALTSNIAAPLLIAAGAGSLANMLLAPLADAKSELESQIEKAVEQEREGITAQLVEMELQIIDSVKEAAEEQLKIDIKSREELTREEKTNEIQTLRRMWNTLFESRRALIQGNDSATPS